MLKNFPNNITTYQRYNYYPANITTKYQCFNNYPIIKTAT